MFWIERLCAAANYKSRCGITIAHLSPWAVWLTSRLQEVQRSKKLGKLLKAVILIYDTRRHNEKEKSRQTSRNAALRMNVNIKNTLSVNLSCECSAVMCIFSSCAMYSCTTAEHSQGQTRYDVAWKARLLSLIIHSTQSPPIVPVFVLERKMR